MEAASLAHLALALAAGSLTTLSPCVFPLLPLVVGGSLQGHRAGPLAMGLGMTLSFALIGLVVGLAGPALGIDGDSVRTAGGWLLLILGVVMLVPALGERFTNLMTPLASGADHLSGKLEAGSLRGALLLGALLGLVWSPCSGPLLAAALTLVATEGGALRGTLILGAFGAGAATPLVLAAYASRAGFARARTWVLGHAKAMKQGFGWLLLLLGVAILNGWDKRLEALIVPFLPEAWVNLTVAI
ncbi:MAG: cytochrome c biogenesis protein CcdA [Betaproteobacteria bacterium]|nr:cytochrome c biogenesis protein CcdA [Betaproteobacteria bacterium]